MPKVRLDGVVSHGGAWPARLGALVAKPKRAGMQMGLRTLLCLALAGFAMASQQSEAQETGTLLTRRSAEIDGAGPDGARRTMEAFTACLVSRFPGRAMALAELPIDSPQYERTARNMYDTAGDECLAGGGRLNFSGSLFRGALFQALYNRRFRDDGPTDFATVESTGYRQLYPAEPTPEARTALALEHFGECVARADAAGVRNFLRQAPGTVAETEAIAALRPRLAACIPQANTIRFSAPVLKGALAEGIYRLSAVARATTERAN
jgi:hypothetical protein